MPITAPNLDDSRGIVAPNYLQILFSGSILALSLIVPVVAYTNHVKRAAAIVGPADFVQNPAVESRGVSENPETGTALASPSAAENKMDILSPILGQSAKLAANQKPLNQGSGNGLVTNKKVVGNRTIQKQTSKAAVRRKSTSQSISRTWYRKSRLKTTLIALWRQTFKKPSKLKN